MKTTSAPAPTRPTAAEVEAELAGHIRDLAGEDATPRPEQVAAVSAMVVDGRRTLLVARTGFGKSAVYFSATRILRDRGWGPTVVISPLLALMRDQVDAARRLGLRAETINSSNLDDWALIEDDINTNQIDLLLISPERLANPGFQRRVFGALKARPFSLVCDEAHCISDWGHDFRPDYRRLRALLDEVDPSTPVLATTATANQRVTDDVAAQLGADTLVLRTSLDRESLRLAIVDLPDDAHRLAWLATTLPDIAGSGIIYCLTVDQAETTARWLGQHGIAAHAYSGAVDNDQRLALETALKENEIKALVATSALGMGFDKGDMAFCIHLGLPPSPVAYYQQIGRAGRAIDDAEVIAVPRPAEDRRIWNWFESVSLPSEEKCLEVLHTLDSREPTSIARIEPYVNMGRSRLATLLKILEVDGAVVRDKNSYLLADPNDPATKPWHYDHDMARSLRRARRDEAEQMLTWAADTTCRMRFLRSALDDPESADCGRCDNCTGESRWKLSAADLDPVLVAAAQTVLRDSDVEIEPRRQWPTGLDEVKGKIAVEEQFATGRALCRLGDGGWDTIVEELVVAAEAGEPLEVSEAMLSGIAGVLKRWGWEQRPTWICPMPSRNRAAVIDQVAEGLGTLGKLPVHRALTMVTDHPSGRQADQSNSAHQVTAVLGRIVVDPDGFPSDAAVARGPVLLVDDEAVSRWTLTVASQQLSAAGLGPVLPFVLRSR